MPAFDRLTAERPAVLYSVDYTHREKLLRLALRDVSTRIAPTCEAIERLYLGQGTEADLDLAIGLYARHGVDDLAQALRDTRGTTDAEHDAQKCRTLTCHRVGISTRGGYCLGCLARARR